MKTYEKPELEVVEFVTDSVLNDMEGGVNDTSRPIVEVP